MVATGELTCFEDVRKLIKHPRSALQYSYDEELLGDGILPKKGEHWVTTDDKALLEEDRADLFACSNTLDAVAGGKAVADEELGENQEDRPD